jgi:hypothetical protein
MTRLSSVLAWALMANTAYAEPGAGSMNGLIAFLTRPDHVASASALAVKAFGKLEDCDHAVAQKAGAARIFPAFGPLRFAADGGLEAGVVTEPFAVTGCGRARTENVLTSADKGQVKMLAGMPGTTLADPVLVRDSFPHIHAALGARIANCTRVRFVDTRFEGFDGPPNPKAKSQSQGSCPWHETWTLNLCGPTAAVTLRYVPQTDGTQISAKVVE